MDASTWQLPLAVTIAIFFCIVMLRANATYWLGRAVVAGTARSRWSRVLDTKAYKVGSGWLNRWGAPAVSLSFLTVGVQTMVNLGAGVSRMPLRHYIPAVTIGSVAWAFIWGSGGFIGVMTIVRLWQYSPLLTIVLGLAAVAVLAALVVRRPAKDDDSTAAAVPATSEVSAA